MNESGSTRIEELKEMINISTRQYAKTSNFFRKVETDMVWNRPEDSDEQFLVKIAEFFTD